MPPVPLRPVLWYALHWCGRVTSPEFLSGWRAVHLRGDAAESATGSADHRREFLALTFDIGRDVARYSRLSRRARHHPARPRLDASGVLHHITICGQERRRIFSLRRSLPPLELLSRGIAYL
jgi:hypothetical protein